MTARVGLLTLLIAAPCAVAAIDLGELGLGERQVTALSPITWAVAVVPLAVVVDWSSVWRALNRTASLGMLLGLGAWATILVPFAPSPARSLAATAAFAVTAGGVVDLAGRSRDPSEFEARFAQVVLQTWVVFIGLSAVAWSIGGADVIRESRLALAAPEANHLARFGALAAVAGLHVALTRREGSIRGAAIVLASSGLAGVLASDSRTATVAVFLGGVVLLARSGHSRTALAAIGTASFAVGALLATGLLGSLADGLRRTADDPLANILAANGRSEIWTPILEVVRERHYLGSGVGSDRQLMLELFGTGRVFWPAEHTHSLILHLLLVVGLPGVVLVAGSLGSAAPHLLRSTRLGVTLVVVVLVDGLSEATVSAPEVAWAALVAGLASTLVAPGPLAPGPGQLACAECSRQRDVAHEVRIRRVVSRRARLPPQRLSKRPSKHWPQPLVNDA